MKKFMLIVTVMLLLFTLVGCIGDPTDISKLESRIEELEESLQQSQSALDSVQDSLSTAQATLDAAIADLLAAQESEEALQIQAKDAIEKLAEAQSLLQENSDALIEAQELIDDLYDQLYELTGVDQRLLSVVQEQKEAIMNMGTEENAPVSYSGGGSGVFGQILASPRPSLLSEVPPFQYNEEWQDMQTMYYEMLEMIVLQGYRQGEVKSLNDFDLQESLLHYGINAFPNEECLIEITLGGNGTLFSRIFIYNANGLRVTKTVASKILENKLQLVRLDQEFDENEVMNSLRIEDFKEDVGLVIVSFGKEQYSSLYYVNYYVGVNVREDLNAIFNIEFMNSVLNSEQYNLTYIENDTITDNVQIYNVLTGRIGEYNRVQTMLNLYDEHSSFTSSCCFNCCV